jgi:hypothetical protein
MPVFEKDGNILIGAARSHAPMPGLNGWSRGVAVEPEVQSVIGQQGLLDRLASQRADVSRRLEVHVPEFKSVGSPTSPDKLRNIARTLTGLVRRCWS